LMELLSTKPLTTLNNCKSKLAKFSDKNTPNIDGPREHKSATNYNNRLAGTQGSLIWMEHSELPCNEYVKRQAETIYKIFRHFKSAPGYFQLEAASQVLYQIDAHYSSAKLTFLAIITEVGLETTTQLIIDKMVHLYKARSIMLSRLLATTANKMNPN